MSYLGYPRLHFSGDFQADPSTVNNDPYHFSTANFVPNDQLRNNPDNPASNGWWNPGGTAYWRFRNCEVKSICYEDGSFSYSAAEDPVIGMPINGADTQVAGKLVDLDPMQQMVSQIWGFEIRLGDVSGDNGFKSDFETAPFCDIWVRYPQGKPDSFFSAVYQSVLCNIDWSETINSRFLKELQKRGRNPKNLSIKFTVDGYNDTYTDPNFTYGRVVGVIGPYETGEPKHFVNARYLRPVATGSYAMNFAYARFDRRRQSLLLDLGNSLQTTAPGGDLKDYGLLELGYLEKDGTFHLIGAISNYTIPDYYLEEASISSFRLNRKMMIDIQSHPLAIRRFNEQDGLYETLLSENAEGAFVRADNFVYRFDPGEKQNAYLYANKFGKPASGVKVNLMFNNSLMIGQQKQGAIGGPPAGTPESALSFPASVRTNRRGVAELPIKASNPGNPRHYIDGQVYGVQYTWDGISAPEYNANSTNVLSILVFDQYKYKGKPTWLEHVQPIMQQYADLYPVMKNVLDLASYHDLVKYNKALTLAFSRELANPNYMPVTRDLSGGKKHMLLKWLQDPIYMKIDSLDDLKLALQTAIELEHATLPPYLTAYFSIKPGANRKVADLIRSVLMEEMLHMSLACNLLNAIGGSPVIDQPGFIPAYPAELPGSLRPGLTVTLKKCSIDHIRDVFMSIEEPAVTIKPKEKHEMTIGWFYHMIAEGFKKLVKKLGADNVFIGDPSRQLTEFHPAHGELYAVTDLDTALKAITEIVEQGEGASPFNPEDGYDELAHFYKFEEIVRGREIVVHEHGYAFTGPVIPFDEDGVYDMVDNPGMVHLTPESMAYLPSLEFNRSYTHLLKSLHEVFNGEPHKLKYAIGLMFSLTVQARRLMQIPLNDGSGKMAGPSFRFFSK